MSRLLTLQDDNGGFELVGNAFKITGAVSTIDDLKKVQTSNVIFFILFLNSFEMRAMRKIKQSDHLCSTCCEFIVCVHVQ